MEAPSQLFDPWSPVFVADPYPTYAYLREQGPAHWFEPTGQWLIPRYENVNALLRDRRLGRSYLHRFTHEVFGQTPPPAEYEHFYVLNAYGLLDLEPPDHSRIRRLVTQAFTARTIEKLTPTIQRIADGIVRSFVATGGGDLLTMVAEPLPVAVIAEMLGVPESERRLLRPWSAAITGMFELNPTPQAAANAVRASIEFSDFLRALIAERRRSPGEDLISALIAAHDEGDRLSEQEMVSTCVLLLNAGHEAAVNATATGWWTLFRHPDQLERLRRKPEIFRAPLRNCCVLTRPSRCSRAGYWMTSWSERISLRAARRSRSCLVRPTAIRLVSTGPTGST